MERARNSGAQAPVSTHAPLMKDPVVERALNEEGYAHSTFLTESEVVTLRDHYASLHPAPGSGFDTDFAYVSPAHKQQVDHGIRAVIEPAIDRIFGPVQLFNVTFVVKWPGADSQLPIHQDWAYVDERADRACTLWIPLDETSIELDNGPLGLIPKSHLLPAHRRGANSVSWYAPYREALSEHLRFPSVALGDALVFDNRVLHGSPTNRTDVTRRAITVMVAHRDTQLVYHHVNGARWETYEISSDFFVAHGPMDLRSDPPVDAPLVEVAQLDPPEAPLVALSEVCGIELDPLDTAQPVQLTGDPLGESAPPAQVGRSGRALHRSIARHRSNPLFLRSELAALDQLAARRDRIHAAWRSISGWGDSVESRPLRTRFGMWEATPLTDGHGAFDELAAALHDVMPADEAWIVRAGPHSELMSRRCGTNDRALVVVPLEFTQPSGSCVLQVGTRMVPLEPYRPVAFDSTWEHTAWNLGAEEIPLLFGWAPRDLSWGQRLVSQVLRARGALVSPSPDAA